MGKSSKIDQYFKRKTLEESSNPPVSENSPISHVNSPKTNFQNLQELRQVKLILNFWSVIQDCATRFGIIMSINEMRCEEHILCQVHTNQDFQSIQNLDQKSILVDFNLYGLILSLLG